MLSGYFRGLAFTFEDDRFDYGEERLLTLGLAAVKSWIPADAGFFQLLRKILPPGYD
jgi:hypothetical protein